MEASVLRWCESQQKELIAFLRDLVECETPSGDESAISRFSELFRERVADIGDVRTVPGKDGHGPQIQCEFHLPGDSKDGQLLVLGHSDTVYPKGILASMPFIEAADRIHGPGVFDMKGGVAMFVFAMRALREFDIPVRRRVLLQLNSDEEVGSPTSRNLTEEEAARSIAVLVVEPAAGADGKCKTGRKGVGDYTLTVHGKSAHAGLDFSAGASAILELARQIQHVATFTDLERGLTVNPGVITGGTRSNVVADRASCEFDFRVARVSDAAIVEERFRALQPFDDRCTLHLEGGLNRPPLERTESVLALYDRARAIAERLGFALGETTVGGGSDGNFTAGLGIPTLDGIGAVGDGAHTPQEHILTPPLAQRTAMLAHLVAEL